MNAAEAIKRIRLERRDWKCAGPGAEVKWTLRGMDIALKKVRDLAQEERLKHLERRPRLSRWIAGDLFNAVQQALAYLKRGDRAKAINTLENVILIVAESRQP